MYAHKPIGWTLRNEGFPGSGLSVPRSPRTQKKIESVVDHVLDSSEFVNDTVNDLNGPLVFHLEVQAPDSLAAPKAHWRRCSPLLVTSTHTLAPK